MKNRSITSNKRFFIICLIAVLFFIAFVFLFIHDGYPQKIISRFSPSKQEEFQSTYNNKALDAWNNCLSQLHPDSDIVFFGDSITRRGNFDKYFPDKSICNLGLGSDTLSGMIERVNMIEMVSPEKVFIMGGINSLRDNTLQQSISEFDTLLKSIHEKGFSEVFVISVLPIAKDNSESLGCSQVTITSFNNSIKLLADNYGFLYIDLYPSYVASDGYIINELTTDGVHLTENAYQIWVNEISSFVMQ